MRRFKQWLAIYGDCILRQNWETGEGNSFGEVEAKGLPRKFFVGRKYGVNLETGQLYLAGDWQQFADKDGEPLKPTKLIYHRHVTKSINIGTGKQTHSIEHHVGFEHDKGMIELCIPDGGDKYKICIGG